MKRAFGQSDQLRQKIDSIKLEEHADLMLKILSNHAEVALQNQLDMKRFSYTVTKRYGGYHSLVPHVEIPDGSLERQKLKTVQSFSDLISQGYFFEEIATLQVSLGGVSILIGFDFPDEVKLISIQKFEMHPKPSFQMFDGDMPVTLNIQLLAPSTNRMLFLESIPILWQTFKKDPTTTLMNNIKPVLLRYINDEDGLALGAMNEQSRSAELFIPENIKCMKQRVKHL